MKPRAMFRARRCRAAAAVEMALVTPVLVTMLFGIIEFGWVFSVKQSLTNAAREGCRVATMQGSTDTQITSAINTYLSNAGLKTADYKTTLSHATANDPTEQVQITVSYKQISLMNGFFGANDWTLGSKCTMRKEGVSS